MFIVNQLLPVRYIIIMVKQRNENLPQFIQLLMETHKGGSDFLKGLLQKNSMTTKLELNEQKEMADKREDDEFLDDSIR